MKEVIDIYYVYRFLNKNKNVLYLNYTRHLEQKLKETSFEEELAKQVRRIEYICFEEEADAELSVVYFNSILNPDFKERYKFRFYEELSFRFDELDSKEWITYEKINDLKWRKDLIREVFNLRIKSRDTARKFDYVLDKEFELFHTMIEFESCFHKKTLELSFPGVLRLIEEMTDNPPRRKTQNYWTTLSQLEQKRDSMIRSLEIEPIEIGRNKELFFRDYDEYTASIIELEDEADNVKKELLKKEKLLYGLEVV